MNEWEFELEGEWEGEFELEGEWEGELEGEFELEGEWEWEGELEGEYESEAFFRRLAALGARAARAATRNPVLRDLGLRAGRAVLTQGLPALGGAIGQYGGASGKRLGRSLGRHAGRWLADQLPARESEWEGEFEAELELNPLRRLRTAALMEHMGHAATEAETEAETEAFIGSLIPLAAQLAPRVAPILLRAAPGLIRGSAAVVRQLRRNPTTRRLIRTVPTIVRQTTSSLAQQVAQGQPVTAQSAVRTLARQTHRVLGNPQRATAAWRQSRTLDRQYHRSLAGGSSGRRRASGCSCGAR